MKMESRYNDSLFNVSKLLKLLLIFIISILLLFTLVNFLTYRTEIIESSLSTSQLFLNGIYATSIIILYLSAAILLSLVITLLIAKIRSKSNLSHISGIITSAILTFIILTLSIRFIDSVVDITGGIQIIFEGLSPGFLILTLTLSSIITMSLIIFSFNKLKTRGMLILTFLVIFLFLFSLFNIYQGSARLENKFQKSDCVGLFFGIMANSNNTEISNFVSGNYNVVSKKPKPSENEVLIMTNDKGQVCKNNIEPTIKEMKVYLGGLRSWNDFENDFNIEETKYRAWLK